MDLVTGIPVGMRTSKWCWIASVTSGNCPEMRFWQGGQHLELYSLQLKTQCKTNWSSRYNNLSPWISKLVSYILSFRYSSFWEQDLTLVEFQLTTSFTDEVYWQYNRWHSGTVRKMRMGLIDCSFKSDEVKSSGIFPMTRLTGLLRVIRLGLVFRVQSSVTWIYNNKKRISS